MSSGSRKKNMTMQTVQTAVSRRLRSANTEGAWLLSDHERGF